MNSGYVSQQSSQASSRMQSPLVYKTIPRHPFAYSFRKFINKIPPIIKYGVPGVAIYQVAKSKFNKLTNSINETQQTKTNMPTPNETPIPRSTYDPSHPRTGYRYHAPFD